MEFTKEQKHIINHRDSEMLVSAAAGSGKTAVLVERIISRILDDTNPIDIDNLLVVTFTKLAAAEMKERITIALEKILISNPSNEHLINQMVMMPSAKIMTIHSFCLSVIRDYFDVVDIDPEFRVADETEIALIKQDVLEEIIENAYAESSSDFIGLVEAFAHGKNDIQIEKLINKIRTFAYGTPFPDTWLKQQLLEEEQIGFNPIMRDLFCKQIYKAIQYIDQRLMDLDYIISQPNGPYIYKEVREIYSVWIEGFEVHEADGISTMDHYFRQFEKFEKQRLSTKRKDMDMALRADAKSILDEIHKLVDQLGKDYFYCDIDSIERDHKSTKPYMNGLYNLVTTFNQGFQVAKKKKKLIDFNDIEHMALQILTHYNSENGIFEPSEIASGYRFKEIMIDEYQDSSMVQEEILRSVSLEKEGVPNIFMVGDVKQSIYKFRMAKPELFLKKYHLYKNEGIYQKAHLTKNFRSRQEVIASVNQVFVNLMSEEFGGVNYDEYAQLNQGLDYEKQDYSYDTEYLVIDKLDYEEKDTHILEALAIAGKIEDLIKQSFIIYDKNSNRYRPVQYHDIAILHRAPKQFTDKVIQVFRGLNIPVYSDVSTGYFDTYEVSTIMNVLRIIDNPDQDIALAGVLKSQIVGLTSEELAEVRLAMEKGSYYGAFKQYLKGDLFGESLFEKLHKFDEQLKDWQKKSKYQRIDQLIADILDETNYMLYLKAMSDGYKRVRNIELLQNRAVSYENTSYQGIFNFIRYVDYIDKYDIELGEASILSEHDEVVRVMSIHKSKGLEFPVVFIAGMGKRFNVTDLNEPLVIHQEYGIGLDYVNIIDRYRMPTLKKNMIRAVLKKEAMEEELRVLYVGMTRAREKLYVIGTVKDHEKTKEKWLDMHMNTYEIEQCNSFQDWVMPLVLKGDSQIKVEMPYRLEPQIRTQDISEEKALADLNNEMSPDLLEWVYKDESYTRLKTTMSVTDLKQQKARKTEQLASGDESFVGGLFEPIVPSFLKESIDNKTLTGARRGTIYHQLLYEINIDIEPSIDAIRPIIDDMVSKGFITAVERQVIDVDQVIGLLMHPIWGSVKSADEVYKEIAFVLGIDANEIIEDVSESGLQVKEKYDDFVMVQGIVDLFFIKDGKVTIIDYKTDYIEKGNEHLLVLRYEEQLKLYRQAIERATNLPVEKCYIYALQTNTFIGV